MTYAAVGPGVALPEVSSPVEVRFGERGPQSRVTALFRIILVIPQLIVLYFVAIAAGVILIIGWFGALFTGRLPQFAVEFLSGFLRWEARVLAYTYFLTGQYPPFSLQPVAEYPVDIWVQTGKLNRWSVLFRIILVIPAAIVATVIIYGLAIFSVVLWAATVITGSLPESFFDATSAAIRYHVRYIGFYAMLTSVYPGAVYGDGKREEAQGAGQPGAAFAAPAPAAWPAAPVGPVAPVAPVAPVPTPAPDGGTPASTIPTVGAVADAPPPLVPPTPGATPIADPSAPSPETAPPGFGPAPVAPPTAPATPAPGIPPITPPPGVVPPGQPPIAPPPGVPSYGPPPAPGAPAYGTPPPYGAPPAYGTPPPYGAPPVAAPIAAAPVPWSPWRLLLSSGGRVLLTIYIILGAVGYVGYIATVSATSHGNQSAFSYNGGSAVDAQNQAVDAYNALSKSAQAYVNATTACQSQTSGSPAQVQCLESADSDFSSKLSAYAAKLAVINYPSSVDTQAQNAQDAANHAATALDSIASAGSDATAFNNAVQSSQVQAALNRVDKTFNTLNTALMNS